MLIMLSIAKKFISSVWWKADRLYGLLVRVTGYTPRGPGSILGAIRFSKK
jgi:hypothetical protein